ncbi:MAG: DoxX family protein [Muribaculaceae bacterium]|nr:DoxX family protein [Muribaculaceae bacterium]
MGSVKKHSDLLSGTKALVALVWLFRIIVGGVFVLSGVTKLIDLWGTVFKIEDYIEVWSIDVPRTVVMMGALLLSTFEFSSGLLLLTGCYRRVVTWLLLACMLFMLPLTAYIWVADPVSDCGCFGDYLVIDNATTFWKNVIIVILVVFLIRHNRKASSLFKAPIQWMIVTVAMFYCLTVSLIGYNIQPLLDFRPYPVGSPLISETIDEDEQVMFKYSRNGEERLFAVDSLPEDGEGWEFVDRVVESGLTSEQLVIFDPVSGEDVTYDYISDVDSLLLLVIPEPARADLSYTYSINELADAVVRRGGNVVALLATGEKGIGRWQDHSMASYPCLSADDTQLKQLARGVMSMVWVTNDTIRWKRTVASISLDEVESVSRDNMPLSALGFDGEKYMRQITALLLIILVAIYILQIAAIKLPHIGCHKQSKGVA